MIIGPTLWASKAAILALYIRIFSPVRWLRLTSYGLILFTFLFYWSNVAVASIFCLPRNGAPWDATAFKRCSSPVASVIVNGVFGVAADLAIFILPFPVVYGLQLGRRKKIGLRIVFSVGLLYVWFTWDEAKIPTHINQDGNHECSIARLQSLRLSRGGSNVERD